MHSIQTEQAHISDIPHSIVRVQGFFKAERSFACICAGELETKLGTKPDAIRKAKFGRPPELRLLVTLGKHAHGDSRLVFNNRLQLPHPCAHKSMSGHFRIVCLGAKPRKTNRDSSADRPAFLPARFRAEK